MPQPIASRVVTDACQIIWLSLPRGLLKFGKWLTTSIMLSVSTDLQSLRRSWIRQFLDQDRTYFMALAYGISSANQFGSTELPYSVEFSSSEETSSTRIAFSFAYILRKSAREKSSRMIHLLLKCAHFCNLNRLSQRVLKILKNPKC